jgi:hypothetical protein
MRREYIWITAREEACSEGRGGVQSIHILGPNAFDDQLASEEIVWTIYLRVGVHIGLLEATMQGITDGE